VGDRSHWLLLERRGRKASMSMRLVPKSLIERSRLGGRPVACTECGCRLSPVDRAFGRALCDEHRSAQSGSREAARARYLGAISAFDIDTKPTPRELGILSDTTPQEVGIDWHQRVASSAILFVLGQALDRRVLTESDDERLQSLATLTGIDRASVERSEARLPGQIAVARANAGRLPVVVQPSIHLRRLEICFLDMPGALLTNASGAGPSDRRGLVTTKGTPVPVLDGGHLVDVGGDLRAWDDGRFVITDQRVFFDGMHVGVQVPHRRLIGFTVFRNAVQVRIAGRRAEPIISVADPLFVAAVGNAAWNQGVAGLPRVYGAGPFDGLPVSPAETSRSESGPARG
jgi:hypothetical protein